MPSKSIPSLDAEWLIVMSIRKQTPRLTSLRHKNIAVKDD